MASFFLPLKLLFFQRPSIHSNRLSRILGYIDSVVSKKAQSTSQFCLRKSQSESMFFLLFTKEPGVRSTDMIIFQKHVFQIINAIKHFSLSTLLTVYNSIFINVYTLNVSR